MECDSWCVRVDKDVGRKHQRTKTNTPLSKISQMMENVTWFPITDSTAQYSQSNLSEGPAGASLEPPSGKAPHGSVSERLKNKQDWHVVVKWWRCLQEEIPEVLSQQQLIGSGSTVQHTKHILSTVSAGPSVCPVTWYLLYLGFVCCNDNQLWATTTGLKPPTWPGPKTNHQLK